MLTWAGATPGAFEREDPASFTARDRKSKLSVRRDSIGPPPRQRRKAEGQWASREISADGFANSALPGTQAARAETAGKPGRRQQILKFKGR
jgi:hypothetical protein